MLGRTETALKLLTEAVKFGGIGRGQLEHDHDLDSLRSDSRFESLLERLEEEEMQHKMKYKMKHKMKHEQKVKVRQLHEES